MQFKNASEIREFCESHEIRFVDFKMIDLDGRWKHLTIPAERFTDATMKYGIGFDGSNYGYAAVEKSDMVFIPDLTNVVVDEFAGTPTLSMMGDVMVIDPKGNYPFDQYARNVVKNAEAYLKKTGIADRMIIGPEYEFYVFDHVSYENKPECSGFEIDVANADWTSGDAMSNGYTVPHHGGYHTAVPQDINWDLRNRMCMMMQDWGVEVKYHHPEVGGCGQLEIEVQLDDLSKMADNTMIVKYIIKNLAAKEGKTATLMPKPVYAEAGNGLHVHMQLFKDGKPVFYDEKGYSCLSDTALYFIGGILKHSASLCGFTNPSTNSYKRLIPGFEAPVTVGYATANRSAVIRIPAYAKAPEDKRFELRNPDATCNPYYAFAAILMAGLDGVANKIDPHENGWGPYDFNLWDLPEEEKKKIGGLPHSLDEALDALEKDHDYLTRDGVFPEKLISIWIDRKHKEKKKIEYVPTPMEFRMYYDL